MSTLSLNYKLSPQAIKRITIETGHQPPETQTVTFELGELSIEDRTRLIETFGVDGKQQSLISRKPAVLGWEGMFVQFDNLINTVDGVFAALQKIDEAEAQSVAAAIAKRTAENAEMIARVKEYLASDTISTVRWSVAPHAPNTAEAQALATLAERTQEERYAKLRAERDAAEAANKKAAQEKEAAEHAARVAWASEHGSTHLQRALAAGHDCTRLYITERVGTEFSDLGDQVIVDWKDEIKERSRSCPSEAALDVLDALKPYAEHEYKTEIVWLSETPDEIEQCEAISVDVPWCNKWIYILIFDNN